MSVGVWEGLRNRFAWPQHVWMEEIRDAPGFGHSRAADGIAMAVWKSRGLTLEGVEVKTSRSDWLRELKQPMKADAIYQFMDHWWLAVSDESLVRAEELPRTWGLLVPRGDKMVAVKEAPKLKPKPLSRGLLAMMLRRLYEKPTPTEDQIRAEVEKRCKEQEDILRRHAEANFTLEMRSYKALKEAVAEFEAKSGVHIHHYEGGHMGAAFKRVLTGEHNWLHDRLKSIRDSAQGLLEGAEMALAKEADAGHLKESA
jgi:hypothetical protein